jgi:hypothetical protein
MYHLVRIFYNKEELNIIIIKISKNEFKIAGLNFCEYFFKFILIIS